MAVGALGRTASRRPTIVAAQLKAGRIGRAGRIGGEPSPRQSEGDALKDKRKDEDTGGEPPPSASRTFRHPIHIGPRLR